MTVLFGLLAGVISFVIGGLWYGFIFRDAWIKAVGISPQDIEASRQTGDKGQKEMAISAILEIIIAIVTLVFIKSLNVNLSPLHVAGGMGVISALSSVKNYLFEQRPIQLILINESYKVICYLVTGIIAILA